MGFYRPKNRPKKGKPATRAGFNEIYADRTGLEPATSAVTGRHSNQLNYRSNYPSSRLLINKLIITLFWEGKDRGFAYFVKKVFKLFSDHFVQFSAPWKA